MSFFILRTWFKQILAGVQANRKEIKKMSLALDNLTAAVDAAVAQLAALTAKVAAADNSTAEQALADKLTAAVAANPI
jgi:hypothetical protein